MSQSVQNLPSWVPPYDLIGDTDMAYNPRDRPIDEGYCALDKSLFPSKCTEVVLPSQKASSSLLITGTKNLQVEQEGDDALLEVVGIQFQAVEFCPVIKHDNVPAFTASAETLGSIAAYLNGKCLLETWLRTLLCVQPSDRMPQVYESHFANFNDFFLHAQPFLIAESMSWIWKTTDADAEIQPFEDDFDTLPRELKRVVRWFVDNDDVRIALFGWTSVQEFLDMIREAVEVACDHPGAWTQVETYINVALAEVKSLFCTRHRNAFGAVYVESQSGDQLWFLYGLNVPVLLRHSPAGDLYTLVGEVFVTGYMHGEILETDWSTGRERKITLE